MGTNDLPRAGTPRSGPPPARSPRRLALAMATGAALAVVLTLADPGLTIELRLKPPSPQAAAALPV